MSYRAVKAYDSNLCIAIGVDAGQPNINYHDRGMWCDFTFDTIPQLEGQAFHHEIVNGSIVAVADA